MSQASEAKSRIINPEPLQPIQISFGDVFEATQNQGKYVITGVGKGRICYATKIMIINRKEVINGGKLNGTTDRKDIEKIVDHWGLDRVLKAMTNYFSDSEPTGRIYDLIREYSTQKPRLLLP